jgi:hypothetical protein
MPLTLFYLSHLLSSMSTASLNKEKIQYTRLSLSLNTEIIMFSLQILVLEPPKISSLEIPIPGKDGFVL